MHLAKPKSNPTHPHSTYPSAQHPPQGASQKKKIRDYLGVFPTCPLGKNSQIIPYFFITKIREYLGVFPKWTLGKNSPIIPYFFLRGSLRRHYYHISGRDITISNQHQSSEIALFTWIFAPSFPIGSHKKVNLLLRQFSNSSAPANLPTGLVSR